MTLEGKKIFVRAISTLLCSWCSDTPAEAVWGVNELLDYYEHETGEKITRLEEEDTDIDKLMKELGE